MSGLKKIIYIFIGQFMGSLTNKRVWAGYLIGICVSLKSAYMYQGYAGDRVYQIFEPYLVHFMTVANVTLMLIGFIVIISDAPFIDNRSTLTLYRTSRGQWFWGMFLYIVVQGCLYYIVSLAGCMIFSMKQGYIHNLWSRPMTNLARFPSEEALVKWNMPRPGELLVKDYTPISAVLSTLALVLLYSLILAVIILIFNTVFNQAVGTIIAAAVHVVGYLLMFDSFSNKLPLFSLYYNSVFIHHVKDNLSMVTSVLYFALVLCILMFVAPALMRHADFKHTAGDKVV